MANNIQVSINTTSPPTLNVTDNGGQNQVPANSNGPTTISFNLTGQLTQGNFVSMSDPNPGFSWIEDPGTIFDKPTITNNGNQVQLVDHHLNSSSNGEWIYMLRVNYNGTIYTTTDVISGPGGTSNNPVIINR
jgi:hypothetical protein